MSSVSGAAGGLAAEGGPPDSPAWGAGQTRPAAGAHARAAAPRGARSDLFDRAMGGYARQNQGQPVRFLRAGCTGPADDLGLDPLRAGGPAVSVTAIDQTHPLITQAAQAAAGDGADLMLGDLRTISLPARAYDVVGCTHLLDRIPNAALVLDRLVAALRPGGLLLLRLRDRDCAAGRLERMLPAVARRAAWHWLRPQQAGPFPAVFDPLLSAAGLQAYVQVRGLVVVERAAVRDRPSRPARLAWGAPLACRLIAGLSLGRVTDGHDDLLYVIRKPESRSARVL
jgi:SAM-dependent methyltransferase